MKKFIIIVSTFFFCLTSCNRAPDNASGGASDPKAKVGGSLHVDSIKTVSSSVSNPKLKPLDSIDTMNKIKTSVIPAIDTVKTKVP